jgi:hypothetical protein
VDLGEEAPALAVDVVPGISTFSHVCAVPVWRS